MDLNPKTNLGGHALILGRPWLSKVDAFISSSDMKNYNANSMKKLTLYPPTREITNFENEKLIEDHEEEYEDVQPILTISQKMYIEQNYYQ